MLLAMAFKEDMGKVYGNRPHPQLIETLAA